MLGCEPPKERRFRDLLTEMCHRHPDIGLSFGYIGNVTNDGSDERSWAFFTKVTNPADTFYKNCFSFGGVPTERLKEFWESAVDNLEQWIVETVEPHKDSVYRVFNIEADPELLGDMPLIEHVLAELGASFGLKSSTKFNISIQLTQAQLYERLRHFPTITIQEE